VGDRRPAYRLQIRDADSVVYLYSTSIFCGGIYRRGSVDFTAVLADKKNGIDYS